MEYFFLKKKKKKVEKIFHASTMNIHGFFFQVFLFFSSKKNSTHVLEHAWCFCNFFSSFDVFQACPSDMRGNFKGIVCFLGFFGKNRVSE